MTGTHIGTGTARYSPADHACFPNVDTEGTALKLRSLVEICWVEARGLTLPSCDRGVEIFELRFYHGDGRCAQQAKVLTSLLAMPYDAMKSHTIQRDPILNGYTIPDLDVEANFDTNSGILSILHHGAADRTSTDRTYSPNAPTMAAMVSPASMYANGPPPPYSSWSAPTSALVSPSESRRTFDQDSQTDPLPPPPPPPPSQTATPLRQSLPSIHEALNTKPYPAPVSTSLPPPHGQLPYSQGPPIPRTYPPSDHAPYPTHSATLQPRQPSPPHPIHLKAAPFARVEPHSNTFHESPRPPAPNLQSAPPPNAPYSSGRYEPPRYESEARAPERAPNGYSHQAHTPQPGSYTYSGPSPTSRPQDPSYSQARYAQESRGMEDEWKGSMADDRSRITPFKQGLKRRYMVWDFENYLSAVCILRWRAL